ncbi:centrosomal protein of 135 kDa-like [Culicoides brevitarsis]|uniref:centrosomal protein of 135 kDa-like n=1 Tax=Culicoides brevitarsis TaxID=469753 RepID=UPI00307B4017
MSLDEKQLQLRKHLDKLGFHQPLPIGAIGLVSALVDDLIQTTESLREAKQEIAHLKQEKAAWDLGAEPYKCDNARLLSEVNNLHIEMLKQRDEYELEMAEQRVRNRTLTHNNKILKERNDELNSQIKEWEIRFQEQHDAKKQPAHKKPFVSTVRSGIRQPGNLDVRSGVYGSNKESLPCSCRGVKRSEILSQIEKLQVEAKNHEDRLNAYTKQIEARDREIQRLNALFTGGRPADALAKDCCYKNVQALTEDVQYLQEQKMMLEQKLAMKHGTHSEIIKNTDKIIEENKTLRQHLKDLEKVALSVESRANEMVIEKDKEIQKLKETIDKTHSKLLNMENGLSGNEIYSVPNSVSQSVFGDNRNENLQDLQKQLNEKTIDAEVLKRENERLREKYSKVKQKLKEEGETPAKLYHDLEKAREDRDYYQKEYSRMMIENKGATDQRDKIVNLTHEVNERNMLISELKKQVVELQSQVRPRSKDSDIQNLTFQSTIHRLERERDVAIASKNQLIIEQEQLKEQLRLLMESQSVERQNHEKHIANLNQQIAHLQTSERELIAHQRPNSATIGALKEDNQKLMQELKLRDTEVTQLKVANSQLKLLLEQTERALSEQKSRLHHNEHQQEHVQQNIITLEAEKLKLSQDVAQLRAEIATLKTDNHVLEKDKERLSIELDLKTDKIYHLETNLENMKKARTDLQDNLDRLQRRMSTINSETIEKETTLRTVHSETAQLRNQVSLLKRTCDNALNENSRLTNELADAQVAISSAKKAQAKAEEDTQTLKEQIKQYVTEVERVNNILAEKEQALINMIDNYKSITQDTKLLEEAKQSLTYENNEARELLKQARLKIADLEEEIDLRGAQIRDFERQVNTLSTQIMELEREVESLQKQISIKDSELQGAYKTIEQLKQEKNEMNSKLGAIPKSRPPIPEPQTTNLGGFGTFTRTRSTKDIAVGDMNHLREKVDKLEIKLEGDQDLADKANLLAQEYKSQVRELRQMITEERGSAPKTTDNENVNPYPTL